MPIVRHEDHIITDQREYEIHRRRDDFQVKYYKLKNLTFKYTFMNIMLFYHWTYI